MHVAQLSSGFVDHLCGCSPLLEQLFLDACDLQASGFNARPGPYSPLAVVQVGAVGGGGQCGWGAVLVGAAGGSGAGQEWGLEVVLSEAAHKGLCF